MNYLELELGGKKRGAKLGTLILKRICQEKKINPDELFQSLEGPNAIFTIPELLYQSFVFNCEKKGEKADFTEDDVFEWIDEAGGMQSKVYQIFTKALMTSLGLDVGSDTGKEQPQKKVAK